MELLGYGQVNYTNGKAFSYDFVESLDGSLFYKSLAFLSDGDSICYVCKPSKTRGRKQSLMYGVQEFKEYGIVKYTGKQLLERAHGNVYDAMWLYYSLRGELPKETFYEAIEQEFWTYSMDKRMDLLRLVGFHRTPEWLLKASGSGIDLLRGDYGAIDPFYAMVF